MLEEFFSSQWCWTAAHWSLYIHLGKTKKAPILLITKNNHASLTKFKIIYFAENYHEKNLSATVDQVSQISQRKKFIISVSWSVGLVWYSLEHHLKTARADQC